MSLVILLLLLCVDARAPVASSYRAPILQKPLLYAYPETYKDFYLRKAANLVILDEVTSYVIQVCEKEDVHPLQMLAVLQVENPAHNPLALNVNYKKLWNKKLKKYVKAEVSRDEGLFQLNNLCLPHFLYFYWELYGETEEFDVNNYQHNTRIAVRLHKANSRALGGSLYYSVLAYNAGIGNVQRGTVPERTANNYWPLFKRYYTKMMENKCL